MAHDLARVNGRLRERAVEHIAHRDDAVPGVEKEHGEHFVLVATQVKREVGLGVGRAPDLAGPLDASVERRERTVDQDVDVPRLRVAIGQEDLEGGRDEDFGHGADTLGSGGIA